MLGILLLLFPLTVQASMMTCHGQMVDEGDSVSKLITNCGAPTWNNFSVYIYKMEGWTYRIHVNSSGVIDNIEKTI